MDDHSYLKNIVKEEYETRATEAFSQTHQEKADLVARAFGYTSEELAFLPEKANMGLGCGNPTAFASLKEGEVVVDLGCGGGLDVILAAKKVGPKGRVIGIDMTPKMIELAKDNAKKSGLTNVQFFLAEIESLPLEDNSVDCVISNCVLNLVPDKMKAFREIYRILKKGGRLAISDIALKKPLPNDLQNDASAYVGCISGAILIDDYRSKLLQVGFSQVAVVDMNADLNVYKQMGVGDVCCSKSCTSNVTQSSETTSCCYQEGDRDAGGE
jgi:arsenite methyltransferase